MGKSSPRRAIRWLGALIIAGSGGLSGASTQTEAARWAVQDSASAAEHSSLENPTPGNSDGWMMLLFGLGTAAYAMRRQQRSFESRHSLAI